MQNQCVKSYVTPTPCGTADEICLSDDYGAVFGPLAFAMLLRFIDVCGSGLCTAL